jgi:DNA topoisomerase-1
MSLHNNAYEGVNIGDEGSVGLITYMRTDSVRISPDAQSSARGFIQTAYGKEYLPAKSPVYSSKSSNVQDAHEAVRPTSVEYTPKEMKKYLDKDAAKLYELIYNRFLPPNASSFRQTTVIFQAIILCVQATGSIIKFQVF